MCFNQDLICLLGASWLPHDIYLDLEIHWAITYKDNMLQKCLRVLRYGNSYTIIDRRISGLLALTNYSMIHVQYEPKKQ